MDDLAGGLPCLAGTSLANSIRQTEFNEFKALDLLVFPSEGARKLARAAYGPEFESLTTAVVRTGIDLPRLSRYAAQRAARERSKSNVFTVVNVAAHVVQKRVDVLLRAIAMLRAELPCRLVNIGEGPLLPRHRDLVIELGIQDSVRFLGRQPNHVVLEHLAQADVFAMPSENVVFDLITLEAMGIGMPVIVTADGGNLECVQDQVNGFLLPPGDPSGLRDRLRMLARGPARADEIGRRAQAVVRTKFSDEVMVREYANHYANLF